jgi:F0F1-type ATP synthase delta subunit
MEKVYAQALQNLVARGMREDEAYEKLHAHLAHTGRLKLLPGLLRELKTLNERSQARSAVLEVASEKDVTAAEEGAKREGITTGKPVVNPALITGWRLTTGDTLIDRSGKRALVDLYRSIVQGS